MPKGGKRQKGGAVSEYVDDPMKVVKNVIKHAIVQFNTPKEYLDKIGFTIKINDDNKDTIKNLLAQDADGEMIRTLAFYKFVDEQVETLMGKNPVAQETDQQAEAHLDGNGSDQEEGGEEGGGWGKKPMKKKGKAKEPKKQPKKAKEPKKKATASRRQPQRATKRGGWAEYDGGKDFMNVADTSGLEPSPDPFQQVGPAVDSKLVESAAPFSAGASITSALSDMTSSVRTSFAPNIV